MGTTLIALTGFEYINNLGRMTRIWEGGWRGDDVGVGLLRNEQGKGEGKRNLEEIEIPQDQQYQLTWTLRGSQRLNHKLKNIHGLYQAPTPPPAHIYCRCSAWS